MKISLFNGSPRGANSNSNTILDWVLEGMDLNLDKHVIKNISRHKEYIAASKDSEVLVMAFPLYSDGMPGIVMAFFEEMERQKDVFAGKKIIFIIHCGFPEGCHCEALKEYLIRLAEKLEMELLDVVIKSGSEAFRYMPKIALEKPRKLFQFIGEDIKNGRNMNQKVLDKLSTPYKFKKSAQILVGIMLKLGGSGNFIFRNELRKNGTIKRSFDKPYLNTY